MVTVAVSNVTDSSRWLTKFATRVLINVAYVVRQFVESPLPKSYPLEVKQLCLNSVVGYAELNSASPTLKMYLNEMGLRGIERVTEINHTTIMNSIKEAGMELSDTPEDSEIAEITEIAELQTFIGNKKKPL